MNERYSAPLRTWGTVEIDLGYQERLDRPFQGEFGDVFGSVCKCGEPYTVNYPSCEMCGRCGRCCKCLNR